MGNNSKAPMMIMSVIGSLVLLAVLIVGAVLAFKFLNKQKEGDVPSKIVAGKDAAGNDLVVCLANHKDSLTPGYIKGGKCVIPWDEGISKKDEWSTFKPEKPYYWTSTPTEKIPVGYTDKGVTQYLCRGNPGRGDAVRVPGKTVDGSVCWVPGIENDEEEYELKPGSFEWASYGTSGTPSTSTTSAATKAVECYNSTTNKFGYVLARVPQGAASTADEVRQACETAGAGTGFCANKGCYAGANATAVKGTNEYYDCKLDGKLVGTIKYNWNQRHGTRDANHACVQWIPACGNAVKKPTQIRGGLVSSPSPKCTASWANR